MTIQYDNLNSTISAVGTATNIPVNIQTKGTGGLNVLGSGQNLKTYSEAILTVNGYSVVSSTFTTVSTATPLGSTATKFVMNSGANAGNSPDGFNFSSGITFSTGVTVTQSLFVKADTYTTLRLRSNVTGGLYDIPVAGPAPAPSGELIGIAVSVISDGWSRISWSYVAGSGAPANRSDYWALKTTAANGTDGLLVVGAQLEVASSVGVYVPTTTTAIYGTPTLTFSGVAGLGLQSDGSLYVQPAGTAALQAQPTTSSTVGGNARGANAVDWQTNRSAATMVASGAQSTVGGGASNRATSTYGTASGGNNNNSSGFGSVIAGGNTNTSSSSYSFVGAGEANTASNYTSAVVAGASNTSAGLFNFIGGGFTNSATSGSAVTTQSATMNGTTAVTLSGSNASIRVGQYITGTSIGSDTYVAAISGTSLTLSKIATGSTTNTLSFFTPHGVVVGGGNNQATGSYSFIGGGGDAGTASNRNVASGDWSTVAGGWKNTASSNYSFVGGGGGNSATTNFGSVVCGGGFYGNLPTQFSGNAAQGVSAFVGAGFSNIASGFGASVVGGNTNYATSTYSAILGGFGGTTRGIIGYQVFPAHNGPVGTTQGSSQAALLIIGAQTTDATATVLRCDTAAAGTTNQVILPNNSAYFFTGEVISGVTGGGNTKGWTIEGVIKRGANAASTALVGTPTVTSSFADAGASTWTIAVTADTTNGGLAVTFTGQAGTTIRTVCQIRTTEMTY